MTHREHSRISETLHVSRKRNAAPSARVTGVSLQEFHRWMPTRKAVACNGRNRALRGRRLQVLKLWVSTIAWPRVTTCFSQYVFSTFSVMVSSLTPSHQKEGP